MAEAWILCKDRQARALVKRTLSVVPLVALVPFVTACRGSTLPNPSAGAAADLEPVGPTASCSLDDAGVTSLGTFAVLDAQGGGISAIAADDEAVYVVTDSWDATNSHTTVVSRVPACGGPWTPLGSRSSAPMTGGANWALVASNRVFLSMSDGIYSVPTTGGGMETETTSNVPLPVAAVYGEELYWIDKTSNLWAVTIGGGHMPRTVARSPSPAQWTSIAVDAKNAYVTAHPTAADGGLPSASDLGSGSILSIALSSGLISTLASGLYDPKNLILAGTVLYWTDNMYMPSIDTANGTGAIRALSLAGGGVQRILDGESPPPGPLMMLGTTMYWIDNGGPNGGDTLRALPSGGAPMTIPAPIIIGLELLIIAPSGAYWSSSYDNQMYRLTL